MLFDPAVAVDRASSLQQGAQRARRNGRAIVVSVSRLVAAPDIVALFDHSELSWPDRCLWAQPGADFALVGMGVAHAIEAVEASRFRQAAAAGRHLLSGAIVEGPRGLPGVGPILLGGFAFDTLRPATALWPGYPHGRLILPRLLFTRAGGQTWLTTNVVVGPQTDVDVEAAALAADLHTLLAAAGGNGHRSPNGHAARITSQELRPAAEWQAEVVQAVSAIKHGELEKVVLARAVQLQSSQPLNAARALRHLFAHYVGCTLFAIARGERCFLGATPEQLVRLRDGEVQAMSLAGSIRRGKSPGEDERLGQALLDSAKDRSEHAVVVKALVEALSETCPRLHYADTPSLLKLGNIQHLCTSITGQLANGHTLLDLVERLHPTPAVGGRPREAALRFIREREGLDRGWYAGPIGWLNAEGEGEFAVALRSALLQGNTATLFAGCGIVADSDPVREYAESRLKLKPMLTALGAYGA
jgi:menaquinone-specific isochorismate synthase